MKLNLFNLRSFFFTKPIQTSSRNSFSLQKCFPFCTTNHPRNFFNDVVPGTSAVYSHALKFQRPVTIKWKPHLENNASFIGTVSGELKRMNSKFGDFGVYTKLRVRNSNQPNSSSFWVLLNMWDDVAEIAYEHLKPNHFICVSGRLESFTRADDDDSGNLRLDYKLNVKQLNFVAQKLGYEDHEKEKKIHAGEQSGGNWLSPIDRLHLWQVFFANPNEWWDQRKGKKNPKQPDFKHKDTGEALWLKKDDPPWVTRQLELLDSNIAEGRFAGRRSRVTAWVYDE
ncbi:unnamed protein product [Trifolium pratense]|uniref:Uncharacterized protein n=1 Tax=Trifolium pratense TaxID=57577 RepID=A0ACB0M3T9_TRIPR|nr:unnamed protein product [Trifolium pratense]